MAKKILIVEDREKFLAPLREHFEREGYSVETASNLQEAQHKISSKKPDRVITDLFFPTSQGGQFRSNGIEIAKTCREKRIPCTLHSTTKNDPIRSLLFRKHLKRAKSLGIEVQAKRETMKKIKRKRPR